MLLMLLLLLLSVYCSCERYKPAVCLSSAFFFFFVGLSLGQVPPRVSGGVQLC